MLSEGLKTYKPLPHRLQFLGEKNGIKYYDDSISTICETTIQALNTLKDVDAVLIGGMVRGIDYSELVHFCPDIRFYIILMEATGKRRILGEIRNGLSGFSGNGPSGADGSSGDAVAKAKKLTRPGHSCFMSPAAASYGIFKKF